jgi:competence protein ComEC
MMRECTPMLTKMAPLIITERRIIIYLCSFMGGIIRLHCLSDSWLWGTGLMQITGAAICLMLGLLVMFIWVCLRGRKIAVIGPLLFALFCGAAGFNLAALQYNLHQPAYVTAPSEVKITAEIFDIDGWASDRSRLWMTIIETDSDRLQLTNARVRVTSKTVPTSATIGAVIEMRVRLFPPPGRILPGLTDFGRNARVADIVASGFVTSSIRVLARPAKLDMSLLLGKLRAAQAADLNDALAKLTGGIAAALVVGDRRFIVEPVYSLFRKSGLAHLLAISGLRMGLLCFGCMAAMRYGAALLTVWASHVPIHKYAAVVAISIGLIYAGLSGASVSAMRAFMMALLVILAVLIDRRALTMRNVALAGFVILALNPVALFSGGFQLSFAATSLLVMAYEKPNTDPCSGGIGCSVMRPVSSLHHFWQIAQQRRSPRSILAALPRGV